MEEKGICCLCGRKYDHYGHNPYPLDLREDARCCYDCNEHSVLPARFALMVERRKKSASSLK